VTADSRLQGWRTARVYRLIRVRWGTQLSDGLFQSGLASFILFSPERAPTATAVAAAFAVVLLPYSLLGPFVGTILDRFRRRNVIMGANIFRSLLLLVIATSIAANVNDSLLTVLILASFAASRLVLAGLSAGLPRLVERERLVPINAVAVTGGTISSVLGGALGYGLRELLRRAEFASDPADALIVGTASAAYLGAALLALRLRAEEIGPDTQERSAAAHQRVIRHGISEVKAGISHLSQRPAAFLAIAAIAVHRSGLTALTTMAVLLSRSTFNATDNPGAGLAGLALIVTLMGIGVLIGASITPSAVKKWGPRNWMRIALIASGLSAVSLVFADNQLLFAIGIASVSAFGQGVKVTADATVQSAISDDFRGRVFSVYDVTVNIMIVIGASAAAQLLPMSGQSRAVPLLVGLILIVAAAVLLTNYPLRRAHHSRRNSSARS
jgi:MFS family permease